METSQEVPQTLKIELPSAPTILSSGECTCPSEIQCLPACPLSFSPNAQAKAHFPRVLLVLQQAFAANPPRPRHTVPLVVDSPRSPLLSQSTHTSKSSVQPQLFPGSCSHTKRKAARLLCSFLALHTPKFFIHIPAWPPPAIFCETAGSWSPHYPF